MKKPARMAGWDKIARERVQNRYAAVNRNKIMGRLPEDLQEALALDETGASLNEGQQERYFSVIQEIQEETRPAMEKEQEEAVKAADARYRAEVRIWNRAHLDDPVKVV